MNCQEFRQRFLTEPRCQDPAFLEHIQLCRPCAEFAAQEAAFEQALAGALAVPVPPKLAARVILNQTLHRARRPYAWSAAAVLLITVSVAIALLRPGFSSLEQEVIAHITDEPEHLAAIDSVPDKKIREVFETIGVSTQPLLNNVRYAGVCPIRRQPGGHLVLAGAHGPVTILFMPHEAIVQQRRIETDGFHGIIVPYGAGSVAIVGHPGEALDDFKRQLASVRANS